jgi:hypothetical protein
MGRYILFAYEKGRSCGARDDEIGRFESIKECLEKFRESENDLYDILDLRTGLWVDVEAVINLDDYNRRKNLKLR